MNSNCRGQNGSKQEVGEKQMVFVKVKYYEDGNLEDMVIY